MTGKRLCGIGLGPGRRASQISGQTFGNPEASRCWGLLWDPRSRSQRRSRGGLADERLLWETTPAVPDLPCAWQIFLQSANPRASYTISTLPLTMSEHYARGHDERIWATAKNLLFRSSRDGSRAGTVRNSWHPSECAWVVSG